MRETLKFYDFFAGAGLATLALRHPWECIWANDLDAAKARVYTGNFGAGHFHGGDVAKYRAADLPSGAHLAWASFPCQDLSLAGWRRGLSAPRSGAFWAFWRIMREKAAARCCPPLIVLENVTGLLHSDSFDGLCGALAALDMQFGALVIDAKHFVPQSRPRVFIIAADKRLDCERLTQKEPPVAWVPAALLKAQSRLDRKTGAGWRWWRLPESRVRPAPLECILEHEARGWHCPDETARLLAMMSASNRKRIEERLRDGQRHTGFLYKRTRDGVQRAEVRFDGLAGCLRTPAGGSSRQTVIEVANGIVRSRLLAPREAARLMGVPDSFRLPPGYNHAYKCMGDAVVVPVVRHLSQHLLEPLLKPDCHRSSRRSARP